MTTKICQSGQKLISQLAQKIIISGQMSGLGNVRVYYLQQLLKIHRLMSYLLRAFESHTFIVLTDGNPTDFSWTLHAMRIKEQIDEIRGQDVEIHTSVFNQYKFCLTSNRGDENLIVRTEFVETLLEDFSSNDLELIRSLFDEEVKCDEKIGRHDNLYQLCFYLYEIANLHDVYRIYNAKYSSNEMDTSTLLDREMLYMNHPIQEVITFVEEDTKPGKSLLNTEQIGTIFIIHSS